MPQTFYEIHSCSIDVKTLFGMNLQFYTLPLKAKSLQKTGRYGFINGMVLFT
jgi:hypothetical protein